jgi:hypothetical protein
MAIPAASKFRVDTLEVEQPPLQLVLFLDQSCEPHNIRDGGGS